ncbi:fimbrial protein [Achromobacter seleniivolatilans]|uniref:Fimbrial protein n=1 Tax=Achromobacter seleniivolatilans TaxID=3047478 RepID=A0ABY9LU79_9BURK|nr:fimbrial protein [Achromobacter sp. R39]WMD18308.1 fimbrial protein [Achromobacter sp. R39]
MTLALAAANANAATIGAGNVEFTGTVIAQTCYVSSPTGDATTVKIDMGTVTVSTVKTSTTAAPIFSGSASEGATFTVHCENKDATEVNLQFQAPGSQLTDSNKVLRVNNGNPSGGYAQNVGIAVYPMGSLTAYDLATGKLLTAAQSVGAGGGTFELSFRAAYVKGAGDPTAGIANATLPFILTTD